MIIAWERGETHREENKLEISKRRRDEENLKNKQTDLREVRRQKIPVTWLITWFLKQTTRDMILTDLKKEWCSTHTFQSLLAALWLNSLKPMVDSNCSNWRQRRIIYQHLSFKINPSGGVTLTHPIQYHKTKFRHILNVMSEWGGVFLVDKPLQQSCRSRAITLDGRLEAGFLFSGKRPRECVPNFRGSYFSVSLE